MSYQESDCIKFGFFLEPNIPPNDKKKDTKMDKNIGTEMKKPTKLKHGKKMTEP